MLERLLNDLVVPLKVLAKFLDPGSVLIFLLPRHERDAVGRVANDEFLVALHAETHPSVEGHPGARPGLLWQNYGDLGRLRQDDGAEGK